MTKTASKFAGLKDKQPPKPKATPSPKLAVPSNDAPASAPAPSRAGKKALTGYFHPQTIKTLKMVALMQDMTQEEAMAEAMDDFFRKYGQSPVGG